MITNLLQTQTLTRTDQLFQQMKDLFYDYITDDHTALQAFRVSIHFPIFVCEIIERRKIKKKFIEVEIFREVTLLEIVNSKTKRKLPKEYFQLKIGEERRNFKRERIKAHSLKMANMETFYNEYRDLRLKQIQDGTL
ncbi:MAG: hypothetical protein IPO16_14730 [Saprospiraceae bacterium]|nr:hypothetical protein [Saprospiraceae bacterium]